MKCEMLISSLLAFGLLAGCTEEIGFRSPPKSGATLFAQNFAVCHGANARGAGAAAVNLEQVPADLTLIAERNGGLFPSDDVLAKIHGYGGPGHFGEMPDFADIDRGENIMWETQNGQKIATPRALVALVRYLEGLQR